MPWATRKGCAYLAVERPHRLRPELCTVHEAGVTLPHAYAQLMHQQSMQAQCG